jgi:hypothetical protein
VIEIRTIQPHPPIPPYARNLSVGDHVAQSGLAPPNVYRCGRHIQQSVAFSFLGFFQSLE